MRSPGLGFRASYGRGAFGAVAYPAIGLGLLLEAIAQLAALLSQGYELAGHSDLVFRLKLCVEIRHEFILRSNPARTERGSLWPGSHVAGPFALCPAYPLIRNRKPNSISAGSIFLRNASAAFMAYGTLKTITRWCSTWPAGSSRPAESQELIMKRLGPHVPGSTGRPSR